ncbi:MAG: folate-binding protein [Gammaproteobacteria bacterium]|nr:folate-binding protein [Gammaproteobacteria bacterium]
MTITLKWHEFLKTQGAQFKNNTVEHFGNIDTERNAVISQDVLCDLTHLGFISVSGDDALKFLQNQLSNDINQVSGQRSQLNAYCTAKGRALALFRVYRFHNDYYLQLPVERIEATIKRLQMFVLMSKVKLQDATDRFLAFGLAGPNATQRLQAMASSIPAQDDACSSTDNLLITKIRGRQARYIIAGEYESLTAAWNTLKDNTVLCGNHGWSYLDIQAGIPQIYAENVEEFVPQMLNLHSIDGISFQKGCYPGQEVVARMHYLGKLKRRMYLAHAASGQPPRAGDLVFSADDQSEQGIGRVVQAQPSPTGGYDLLAVLQIAYAQSGLVHLFKPDGPALTLRELPYAVALEREDKPAET